MSTIYKVKDISSALKKKGFVENGLKEYGDSLISLMKNQLHLQSKGEFQDLINCPMTKEEYLNILIERGHVR